VSSSFINECICCLEILEFGLFHNESLPEGLQDVADTLTPKFVIMSAILFGFCLACSIVLLEYEGSVSVDWVRSKPLLGLAGKLGHSFQLIKFVSRFIVSSIRYYQCIWSIALAGCLIQCNRQRLAFYHCM
jgi:hypothetical protein